jgi:isocitrate dehydrogenase
VRAARPPSTSSSWSGRTTCAGTASGSSSRWPRRSSTSADTLDRATGTFLENDKSPTRRVGGIDNRGSHFYLALYWAQELARQTDDPELASAFATLAEALADKEDVIVGELNAVQGHPVDIGGYYRPDDTLADRVMRPSATLNEALASLG